MSKPDFVVKILEETREKLTDGGVPAAAVAAFFQAILDDEDMYYETEQQARLYISVRFSHYTSELAKAAGDVLVNGERG